MVAVAGAGEDDRDLAAEGDEGLQDRRRLADRPPGRHRVVAGADQRLALAVIAEAARLEHRRAAGAGERRIDVGERRDRGEGRHGDAELGHQLLLGEAVLGHREAAARPGDTVTRAARNVDGGGRDVLELVGDDVDGRGEIGERRLVVVGRDGAGGGDGEGRALRVGAVDVAGEAELGRGHRQHAAELAAAENADDRRRAPAAAHPSSAGRSATAAVCPARQRSSRSATAASAVARMAAASSAALMAPERPMASVPTGTPAGIWTME